MTNIISTPVLSKKRKSAADIEAALNKALRAHPECKGFKVLKLTPLEGTSGLANWDAEFGAEPNVAMSSECKRVLLGVKHGVQKRFDLA